jgi:hypothetical protein
LILEAKEGAGDPRYSDDHDDSYHLIQSYNDSDSETGDVNKTGGIIECPVDDGETESYVL